MQIKRTMRCNYFYENGYNQKDKIIIGENMEQLLNSRIADGKVRWGSHFEKQFGS